MGTNFEKTDIYKRALKEYQQTIYWEIIKPLHSIILDEDEVYLLYNQITVLDILVKLKEIYNKEKTDENTDFPINLWYGEPEIIEITFMWNKYKAIYLWFDHCDVPIQFKAKI